MVESGAKTSPAFSIAQAEGGYRYSIEPFLLADFAQLLPGTKVLDVGTGCGIIPLLLLTREARLQVTAVEIQPSLYEAAVHNISQNGLSDRVEVLLGDFAQKDLLCRQFDMIVSNPPYRKINSGRINPDRIKALARHELALTLSSLLENASGLLKPEGGIVLAYPPVRLEEIRHELMRLGFRLGRLRFVHGCQGTKAKIVLIEAVKGGSAECVVESPFYVYNSDGSYSREMQAIYVSFNYTGRSHRQRKK